MIRKELLTTIGLSVSSDFPRVLYESFWAKVSSSIPPSAPRVELGFGWNAVAYRFKACEEANESFKASLSNHGASPPPEERFSQERWLFEFFTSGQAVLESFAYASYAVGTLLQPQHFQMLSAKDLRKITVKRTFELYKVAFPQEMVTATFDALVHDPSWEEWTEVRNVLAHRSAPGRTFAIGGGTPGMATWKTFNFAIEEALTADRKRWLAETLTGLIEALDDLAAIKFPSLTRST